MTPQVTDTHLTSIRRRLLYVLFSGATLGWIAFISTITVATVAARSLTGSTLIAGFPLAAGALGQALGTNLFGRLSAYRGRRFILLVGPPISALGATLELLGVVFGWYWLLLGGALFVGGGIGAVHLIRYAAAEISEEHRTARAMGFGDGVHSVVGHDRVVGGRQLGGRGGPDGGGLAGHAIWRRLPPGRRGIPAWLIFWTALRPDPSQVAVTTHAGPAASGSVSRALRLPGVQLSILALLSAQAVMVMVTTAAPLRIEDAGHGLDVVGVVISTHAVGMFAFAPLVGRLVDRMGPLLSLAIGVLVIWISLFLSATASYEGFWMLNFGLFVLGLGWCFSFVAGSSMLFASAPSDVRQIVEGWADSAIWTMVMLGSAGAGVLMSTVGFEVLNLVAAAPLLLIVVLVFSVPSLRAGLAR